MRRESQCRPNIIRRDYPFFWARMLFVAFSLSLSTLLQRAWSGSSWSVIGGGLIFRCTFFRFTFTFELTGSHTALSLSGCVRTGKVKLIQADKKSRLFSLARQKVNNNRIQHASSPHTLKTGERDRGWDKPYSFYSR